MPESLFPNDVDGDVDVDVAENPRIVSSWENLGPPPRWYAYAACHHSAARIWFPKSANDRRAATELCATCRVRRHCLEYALEHAELIGIWGGLTFEQRIRLRAERRRAGGENATGQSGGGGK